MAGAKPIGGKRLLMSMGEIQQAFCWSQDQFYMFLKLGLPVRKINGRWYGHSENIDVWLRALLNGGKPIDVRTDCVPVEVFET